jgi:cytochrome P450
VSGANLLQQHRPPKARTIPLYRHLFRLARDPDGALNDLGRQAAGEVVRLDLGLSRPYLVSHPEHVQRVLRDNAGNYLREGMLWKPVRRLVGNGISSEGPTWRRRRTMVQPLFSARHIASLVDRMARTVTEAVDALDPYARDGRPVDVAAEMTRIVQRALVRAFFGGRISAADAGRLGPAIDAAFTSLAPRMLLPFVPHSVPLPGDRAFLRAVRTVDEVMYPLVREGRRRAGDSDGDADDLVTLLCRARDPDGNGLDDQQVRDDVVGIFVAGIETSAAALTWLWAALDAHPEVAAGVRDEVERVVGSQPLAATHVAQLTYTGMVLREVLRLYPVAWIIPRTAKEPDEIGGVPVDAGATVLVSPYLTHRMEGVWERPHVFDPQRFAPGGDEQRHRYSYLPFGGGAHHCIGSHFFTVEATLIVAAMFSRYRTALRGPPPSIQPAATLRPRRRVEMVLTPIEGRGPSGFSPPSHRESS